MPSLQPAGTQTLWTVSIPQRLHLTLSKAEQGAVDREMDKLQSSGIQNRSFFYSFALPEEVEAVQPY